MSGSISNEDRPFGSARFAGPEEAARAGMFRQQRGSLLVGFLGPRPLWYSDMGGLLLIAGARSGKLRDILAYNVCPGTCLHSMLILDMKGELAAISLNQTSDRKFCGYWSPIPLHGIRGNRINPLDYIRIDSPTLVSDVKVFAENMIPASGSPQSLYFEGRAREFLEGIVLALVRLKSVLTFPELYRVINLLVAGGNEWLDFAFEMAESGFPLARRVEEEIAAARKDSSGGFRGILGELTKAFACLSDPSLMASVSPPFDFSLSQLCESDRAWQIYLMPPAEFIDAWAPVIKAIFVAGMIYKSRAPAAPQQTWILDECAQLGAFPLAVKLFTYGAGIGIRPWAVFQSADQMKALGPDAKTIVSSSAGLQSYFGVRDLETASTLSKMLGSETLGYVDAHRRAEARYAQQRAARRLFGGGNPFRIAQEVAHHARMASLPVLTHRALRNPDELLGMPGDRQIIFADGLEHPLYAERRAYFDQPFMAGRYHPSPFHPPADKVRVRTRGGYAWRRVIVEPVPRRFAHYPQYVGGTWSRIG
ncbi:type IV secretory system conjugative DNA transfer family protein [Marinibaculum pumilum]|uniref:Type IV secretory system conjugative DNA transfer family protein n=1 Tax=Marinibaculum pumilum TaxID=1766165 RepID=A0ABV7L3A1_9PROT